MNHFEQVCEALEAQCIEEWFGFLQGLPGLLRIFLWFWWGAKIPWAGATGWCMWMAGRVHCVLSFWKNGQLAWVLRIAQICFQELYQYSSHCWTAWLFGRRCLCSQLNLSKFQHRTSSGLQPEYLTQVCFDFKHSAIQSIQLSESLSRNVVCTKTMPRLLDWYLFVLKWARKVLRFERHDRRISGGVLISPVGELRHWNEVTPA